MKKLLLLAAFGVAGLVSANSPSDLQSNPETKNFTAKETFFKGTCTIQIYRDNHDGTSTLVYSNTVQTDTAQQCWDLRDQILEQAENEHW